MTREEAIEWLSPDTSPMKIHIEEASGIDPMIFINKAIEVAITAMKELNMYKEGGLVLIPTETFKNQCERLDELEPLQNPLEVDEILLYDGKTGYQCKNCGNELAVNRFNGNYCNWCGQKLEWRNKND